MLICFLSCVSFLFLPARAINIYTKHTYAPRTHTYTNNIRASFHPITRALTRRHVEPTVECAPHAEKKVIYYTFFSGSFVCVYFLNINMLMIFPSRFSFFYFLCVCGLYTSRVQLHPYFLLFVKKNSFSLFFAWCRGVVYIKLVIWINMYRYLQGFLDHTTSNSSFVCPNFCFRLITYLRSPLSTLQPTECLVLPHLLWIDIFKISSTNSRSTFSNGQANKLLSLVRSHTRATLEKRKKHPN